MIGDDPLLDQTQKRSGYSGPADAAGGAPASAAAAGPEYAIDRMLAQNIATPTCIFQFVDKFIAIVRDKSVMQQAGSPAPRVRGCEQCSEFELCRHSVNRGQTIDRLSLRGRARGEGPESHQSASRCGIKDRSCAMRVRVLPMVEAADAVAAFIIRRDRAGPRDRDHRTARHLAETATKGEPGGKLRKLMTRRLTKPNSREISKISGALKKLRLSV